MTRIPKRRRQFGKVQLAVRYQLRPGGYVVVSDIWRRIAIVETAKGCYLPGGGCEPGETREQAAKREALEECGLEVELVGPSVEADQLVYSASEDQYFRKRCLFIRVTLIRIQDRSEPDHRLVWLTLKKAVHSLSHESQSWAVTELSAGI
jgi:8-oxo-dGTP pyrophosphatase MutT (NUDIX family)